MPKKAGRGRPPEGEFKGKSATLTTRITPELRWALDRAAKKNGRSLSQEIERRLKYSFDPEFQRDWRDRLAEAFGGRETFGLMILLAEYVRTIEHWTGQKWSENPYTLQQARDGISLILDALAPKGDPQQPSTMRFKFRGAPGDLHAAIASTVLAQLDATSLPDPVPRSDDRILGNPRHLLGRMRSEAKEYLGDVANRVKNSEGDQ